MSSRKKIIKNIVLFICCLAVAGGAVLYNYGYKMCWKCSTQDYYERGREFVCRDKAELQQTGLDFLRLAAEHQQPRAQILLAECYSSSLPADYSSLDAGAYKCLNGRLRKNSTAATALFKRAYATLSKQEQDNGQLLFNLARLVAAGVIKTDNPAAAHELYVKAAEHENYLAKWTLALHYNEQADYAAAEKWLRSAAEDNKDAAPALLLGDYFMYGKGQVVNYEKAIYWYREALETQKKVMAKSSEEERLNAEDVPRARMDVAMRQLHKERLKAKIALHYHIGGNANHYVVYSEDHSAGAIGTVTKSVEGVTAKIDDSVSVSLTIPTTSKTFESMNEGMEWLLHSYARSRYGSYTKAEFILQEK